MQCYSVLFFLIKMNKIQHRKCIKVSPFSNLIYEEKSFSYFFFFWFVNPLDTKFNKYLIINHFNVQTLSHKILTSPLDCLTLKAYRVMVLRLQSGQGASQWVLITIGRAGEEPGVIVGPFIWGL